MRRILAASLMLSPMLFTASAIASQPTTGDADASTPAVRISTGVTAPKLIQSNTVVIPGDAFDNVIPQPAEVSLTLSVDETGKPQDIQVVKSVNKDLDARVIEAVRKLQWHPGKLDNQAIPVDMTLDVNVVVRP